MYNYFTLANGIRIVHRQTDSVVAYSGVYVNVGSRDEQGPEEGAAHFIEHSIFKGTDKRRPHHIRNRIDGVGGELDAFTTKEETCIYATSLARHLPRCIELFADLLFRPAFPLREIKNEKEVVAEEINLYKDSPADLIYDEFEERFFGAHPLGHNILGTKRNVRRFSPEFLHAFMAGHYTPDRMVISVVGNVEFDALVRLCRRYFEAAAPRPAAGAAPPRTAPAPAPFSATVTRHTHQVHLLIGCAAPSLFDPRKTAFALLNNLLGGPAMNSRLNVSIREKHGFCYSVESQYVPFTDAGLFYIYAGVDSDAAERSTELILAELRRLRDVPLTHRQIAAAQQQMVGQMAITNDSGLNEMQSIGKACLNYGRADTLEEMAADLRAVTAEELQQTARSLLAEEGLSYLYYR